jgi:glycosyltransferase involved in cell wall biosynthesis
MKVLIIAEEANPEWVSVPLIGWNYSRAIANEVKCTVVTQIRNKEALIKKGLIPDKDFITIDSEFIAKPLFNFSDFLTGKGKGWTTRMAFSYFYYPFFERLIWKKLGKRIKAGEFDIVHRIVPLSPTQPSLLAKKCHKQNIPFILGPLNGGLPWPRDFDKERRREKEWLSYIRNVYKFLPGYKSTRKFASAIIYGSKSTGAQIEQKYHSKCFFMPENGIDIERFSGKREKKVGSPIKAIFIGRLVPYKGADMLLRGFRNAIISGKIDLSIVGDGPEKESLEQLAVNLGISDKVVFHGWVNHSEVQNYLIDSDILSFPSIREFGGGVVLEAMALGVMPLIVDYGGPAELVTPECAMTIPLGDKENIIKGLSEKAEYLINNPEKIDTLGAKAREIVQKQFTWEKKAQKTLSLYKWILNPQSPEPDLMELKKG